ncbi:AraC family transcriptional regulator [Anaerocolumna sp. MB42-C2]|uniref:AraC family transcriptional regulator n=1 Tax=Anaerocolumna sp. MB42-C2 TaxID=3070997 RepID=UPI0027DFCC6F|nr:AraC family transcriptional regulator [Anaerocolumna sp. MB42-C2]WMJ86504.1 AraC family transcriptional regulator [Anaerocolumna sp. MB42-C2]
MLPYKTLDNILHQLEPEEELYKAHHAEPDLSDLPYILSGNTPVYVMAADIVPPFSHAPHPSIMMRKTNRFINVYPHVHPWIELGYMYSGSCDHTIFNTSHTLKKGQVFILDSEAPHSVENLGENDILITMIMSKPYFTDSFFNHFSEESVLSRFLVNAISKQTSHDNYIIFNSEKNRRVTMFFLELMCEHISPSMNSQDMINSLISLLFLELISVFEADKALQQMQLNKSTIVPILKYIESNYKSCDLKSTAAFFNMNPNYLTTILKRDTGYSFKELIQKQRFRTITNLLRNTKLSVEEIAFQTGYENTTYFYKKFKEEFDCSPKQYRNQHKINY